MIHRIHRSHRPGLMAGAATLAVLVGSASAAVLHDTTAMTDNQVYTTSSLAQSFIGGALNNSGTRWDMQAGDDFTLVDPHLITSVTADFLTLAATPATMPAEGVLVEFFPDTGAGPSNTPFAQYFAAAASVSATTFTNTIGTATYSTTGIRFTVDLSTAGIELGTGTWWMSVVPVDSTDDGRFYYNVSRAGSNGLRAHHRSAGTYHGTGYGGTFQPQWTQFILAQRDLAFRVEGTPIPAPWSFAALAGLAVTGRRRRL